MISPGLGLGCACPSFLFSNNWSELRQQGMRLAGRWEQNSHQRQARPMLGNGAPGRPGRPPAFPQGAGLGSTIHSHSSPPAPIDSQKIETVWLQLKHFFFCALLAHPHSFGSA